MFVRLDYVYYNTDHIISIVGPLRKENDPRRREVIITFTNREEKTVEIQEEDLKPIIYQHVVPAQPNWYMALVFGNLETGETVKLYPILAFYIDEVGLMQPIGVEGENETNWDAIIDPTGRVTIPAVEEFDDVATWLESRKKNKRFAVLIP